MLPMSSFSPKIHQPHVNLKKCTRMKPQAETSRWTRMAYGDISKIPKGSRSMQLRSFIEVNGTIQIDHSKETDMLTCQISALSRLCVHRVPPFQAVSGISGCAGRNSDGIATQGGS